jgi:hypothetical protein
MSGGHGGHVDPSSKKVAMLISVLALVLAISETLGKGAQTTALNVNIEAANLWNFFQAKTIRGTVLKTAAEEFEAELPSITNAQAREAMEKRIAEWKKNEARYQSEPETGEGRKELMARALADRHRAGIGRGDHGRGSAGVGFGRTGTDRYCVLHHRHFLADRGTPVLSGYQDIRQPCQVLVAGSSGRGSPLTVGM